MADFVAYYRVSTARQGQSGLGLDAQRAAVSRFLGDSSLLAEFVEVESGKRHTNRPQLLDAIAECRKARATLLIAKLDRLARNVAFVANLMESDVEFVACDMPQANRLTVHILAAVAEHEREMISARTTVALAAAKRRGTQLGNPRWRESITRARAARHPAPMHDRLRQMIRERRSNSQSFRQIAHELNSLGLRRPSGAKWYASTVRAVLL